MKVNFIKNLPGVRHAVLKVKYDGDHSANIYGFKDKDHIIQFDYRATFVNIALKSNSVFTIEAFQGLELTVRSLGKVILDSYSIQLCIFGLDFNPCCYAESRGGDSRHVPQIFK